MPLIIAVTDFSGVGRNAVNYACGLAEAYKADILVINTFVMPVMFTDIPVPSNNLVNDEQNDAQAQMGELISELQNQYPVLSIKGKVVYGDVIDALEDRSDMTISPWLVVVGNDNDTNSMDNFDNVLLETLKDSEYPVLAVPPMTSFQPVEKMCFAYDNKYNGSDVALLQLRDMQQLLGARLDVLYASTEGLNQDNIPVTDSNTQVILADANAQYHYTSDASIEDAVLDFARDSKADWLVVLPRRHSFFEGLFHKGHTKAFAHATHIPILALHENRS